MKNRIFIYFIIIIKFTFFACEEDNSYVAKLDELVILSVYPNSGTENTIATIIGRNFSSNRTQNTVKFNDVAATVLEASPTELQVVVPKEQILGEVQITVTVNDEKANGLFFTYVRLNNYIVSIFAGSGEKGNTDALGVLAQFNAPFGVAVDSKGNVLVADKNNHLIRKIAPDGMVSTFAGGVKGFKDAKGTEAQFNSPYQIAIDGDDNAYVADMSNRRIRKITPDGVVTTIVGTGASGTDDGDISTATFNLPAGVAIDNNGDLIISDYGANRIRKFTFSDNMLSTIAGDSSGYTDGTGAAALFNRPALLTVDKNNNIFVPDRGNHCIRKITQPNYVVSTFAGTNSSGDKDGEATMARFNQPSQIIMDNNGEFLVTDYINNKIRKITSEGIVSTYAGEGTTGQDNGPLLDATFNRPYGIAINSSSSIYVSDAGGNRIRKIFNSKI